MRAFAVACCIVLACQVASAAIPAAGPVGEKTPPAKWGAVVHDKVNDEYVWFGGVGGRSKSGALRTWILKDGKWRPLHWPFLDTAKPGMQAPVRALYAAVANRYYRSETPDVAKADLAKMYGHLAELIAYMDVALGPPV